MVLQPGTMFGPYEIVDSLGVGGMGEVYRAKDTTLKRDVAIKALPAAFATDPQRVARFKREAESLAALNHPNIAQIYGLASHDGTQAIVMELVEGQDLAERLDHGPMPLPEVLGAARQIALALEAAHEHGIIHRDLKPANIKVSPDGVVKLLDFGIAKVATGDSPGVDFTQAPTVTASGTAIGLVIGTAGYMSPEQARGKALDRRADLWAFGCVLYEMLAGRPAFRGDDVTGTLAKVLESSPELTALPAETPPSIRRLLQRCLVKEPRDRLGDAATARFEIEDALNPTAASQEGRRPVASAGRWWRQPVPWLLAAVTLAVGITSGRLWRGPYPEVVTRLEMLLPPGDRFVDAQRGEGIGLAWSPDGRVLIYAATRNGQSSLFKRSLDQVEPALIPGTEGASDPVVLANGEWVAFTTPGPPAQVKKVRLSGGPAETLATAQSGIRGIDVSTAGELVFGQHTGGLTRVPAQGGAAASLTMATPEGPHRYPSLLPGGGLLLTVGAVPVANQIAVQPGDGRQLRLLTQGTYARYVPTGHVVYWVAGSLWAAAFDLSRLEAGAAYPVVSGVRVHPSGHSYFAWARNGSLAYVPARDVPRRTLVWVDRTGSEVALPVPPGPYLAPRLSPDASKVLLAYRTPATEDIWIADLARGTADPFMQEPASEWLAEWTADGERIIFSSRRLGSFNFFWKRANGLGNTVQLGTQSAVPLGRSPDGGQLLYSAGGSLGVVSLADGKNRLLWDEPGAEFSDARFSPDGRWIAYSAGPTGQHNVWVRPYPDVLADRRKIDAGRFPRWSADSKTLFYQRDSGMMSVALGDAHSTPVQLFSGPYARDYDLARDGRFLMIREVPQNPGGEVDRIIVVLNWFQELKNRVR